jgi:hypothetical protein
LEVIEQTCADRYIQVERFCLRVDPNFQAEPFPTPGMEFSA